MIFKDTKPHERIRAVAGFVYITTRKDSCGSRVKFKFVSKQNLEIFKKAPKKYIPAYGGFCAYAVGAKAERVSIDPETFEIRAGKLYLFYNAWGTNTFKMWQEEGAEQLKEKADKNWVKIKKEK